MGFNDQISSSEYLDQDRILYFDSNLEKLACYFRSLGVSAETIDFAEFSGLRFKQKKVFVTCNKIIRKKGKHYKWICLPDIKPFPQAKLVVGFLRIKIGFSDLMSRCVRCNFERLEQMDRQQVHDFFWERKSELVEIESTISSFLVCDNCMLVFWKGPKYQKALEQYKSFVTF